MNEVKKVLAAEFYGVRFERIEGDPGVRIIINGQDFGTISIESLRRIIEILEE